MFNTHMGCSVARVSFNHGMYSKIDVYYMLMLRSLLCTYYVGTVSLVIVAFPYSVIF